MKVNKADNQKTELIRSVEGDNVSQRIEGHKIRRICIIFMVDFFFKKVTFLERKKNKPSKIKKSIVKYFVLQVNKVNPKRLGNIGPELNSLPAISRHCSFSKR